MIVDEFLKKQCLHFGNDRCNFKLTRACNLIDGYDDNHKIFNKNDNNLLKFGVLLHSIYISVFIEDNRRLCPSKIFWHLDLPPSPHPIQKIQTESKLFHDKLYTQ